MRLTTEKKKRILLMSWRLLMMTEMGRPSTRILYPSAHSSKKYSWTNASFQQIMTPLWGNLNQPKSMTSWAKNLEITNSTVNKWWDKVLELRFCKWCSFIRTIKKEKPIMERSSDATSMKLTKFWKKSNLRRRKLEKSEKAKYQKMLKKNWRPPSRNRKVKSSSPGSSGA